MQDILVNPNTYKVVEAISQKQWERKWAEIISMHCSPHDVWTVHHNWTYVTVLPDKRVVPGTYRDQFPGSTVYRLRKGIYSLTDIHGKNIVVEIDKCGRRLIRNHRAYWKSYLVPNFFSEEQWDYLCKYHKEKYRQLFCKGKTYPITENPALIEADSKEVIEDKISELYKRFRRELRGIIGKDYYNETYRMDCWNWGSGDCSDFVPFRVNFECKRGDTFDLSFLSEETRVRSLDKNIEIKPRYHKIITSQKVTA